MSEFSGLQNPKLFLSHAWANKPFARRVARRLGHRGFEVWLDEQRIQPGEALTERVRQAIQSSSRHSRASHEGICQHFEMGAEGSCVRS
jgi:hypothetical protein